MYDVSVYDLREGNIQVEETPSLSYLGGTIYGESLFF
jgi:hypothetical protein